MVNLVFAFANCKLFITPLLSILNSTNSAYFARLLLLRTIRRKTFFMFFFYFILTFYIVYTYTWTSKLIIANNIIVVYKYIYKQNAKKIQYVYSFEEQFKTRFIHYIQVPNNCCMHFKYTFYHIWKVKECILYFMMVEI